MVDFLHEQQIVQDMIGQLPPETVASAQELAGELRWQFRLTILVVLNLIVTGFAVLLLWRGYRSSQESLRDLKALASDILSSMDQAVITTDLLGQVTSINRRGMELLAVTDECVGKPLSELSQDGALEMFLRQSQSANSTEQIKDVPVQSNGATRTLRAYCQPLRNHENSQIGHVVQLRDVTERVLMDDRLRRMERYMGLGSLVAGLHHEIKNPLAALSLHVQLLEEVLEVPETPGTVHEMLEVIKTELARIGGVLESFQDFASIQHLSRSPVDIPKLVRQQVKLITPQSNDQGIDIRLDLPDRPIQPLSADRTKLEQVFLNLLINAMEAMPDGGTLTVRVETSEVDDAESVRLEVIDSGIGIPEDVRDRIFDPYFTTKSRGTGMGLALCDKIIRQHNGSLTFRTGANWTAFEVALPLESELLPNDFDLS